MPMKIWRRQHGAHHDTEGSGVYDNGHDFPLDEPSFKSNQDRQWNLEGRALPRANEIRKQSSANAMSIANLQLQRLHANTEQERN